jgi:hypothetical protein
MTALTRTKNAKSKSATTNERWSEYRQHIRDLNVTELAFGRDKSVEVFAFYKTPKIGFFRNSYGYLYCPEIWDRRFLFVPCGGPLPFSVTSDARGLG